MELEIRMQSQCRDGGMMYRSSEMPSVDSGNEDLEIRKRISGFLFGKDHRV